MANARYSISQNVILVGDSQQGLGNPLLINKSETTTPNLGWLSQQATIFMGDTEIKLTGSVKASSVSHHRDYSDVFYRKADIIGLVFDPSDKQTFTNIKQWVNEVRRYNETATLILVADNSKHTDKARVVSRKDAKGLAETLGGISYFESTDNAKISRKNLLELMACEVVQLKEGEISSSSVKFASQRKSHLVAQDEQIERSKTTSRSQSLKDKWKEKFSKQKSPQKSASYSVKHSVESTSKLEKLKNIKPVSLEERIKILREFRKEYKNTHNGYGY